MRWMGLPQELQRNGTVTGVRWEAVHPSERACHDMAQAILEPHGDAGITEARFVAAMVPEPPCQAIPWRELNRGQPLDPRSENLTPITPVGRPTEWRS